MPEEKDVKIVYHKSNWASQALIVAGVMAICFFLYKKNPTKETFSRELVRQFASKKLGINTASINIDLLDQIITPLIERKDFLIFSTYKIKITDPSFPVKIDAIGFWDSIIITDTGKVNNQPPIKQKVNWGESDIASPDTNIKLGADTAAQ